jgi:hypothetical protein
MLRYVALLRTDVSEEIIASIIIVTRIGHLRTMSAITNNRSTLLPVNANVVPISTILVTLIMETILSSETSVLTRATRLNIAEDDILHNCHENLKSYIALTAWAL